VSKCHSTSAEFDENSIESIVDRLSSNESEVIYNTVIQVCSLAQFLSCSNFKTPKSDDLNHKTNIRMLFSSFKSQKIGFR
jgi:hypothetical protein